MVRIFRKKYVTFLFLQSFAVLGIFAGEGQELFLRANKYYVEKDYDNALKTYDMIAQKGSAVFYNMGNCYYNKHEYAYALVCWSRAEVGANNDEYKLIQHNKERAFAALGKQKKQQWWWHIVEFLQSSLPDISLFVLQFFFLLCWSFFIIAMRKKQTGYKKIMRGVLSFCIVICAVSLGMHYIQDAIHSAIVVKKDAQLFAGPDKSFHILSPIAYADHAAVKETRTGWHKIKYADMIGWVESDVIQVI
jgi:tetratricopeptide (TPR) repeat protein